MHIEVKYNIGDTVYLKTDPDRLERLVTAITVTPNGITYVLHCGAYATGHYAMEITTEKALV